MVVIGQWLRDAGRAGELWFYHGCLPLPGAGRDCQPFLRAAIDHVLLISARRYDPNFYDSAYLASDAADAALERTLSQGLGALAVPGWRLVLVDPMFTAAARVPQRLALNLYFGRDLPIDTPAATHAREFGGVHRAFAEAVKRPGVIRISLIDELCKSGICQGTLEGGPLFFDDDHIRFSATGYFAEVLAQQYAIGETTRHEH